MDGAFKWKFVNSYHSYLASLVSQLVRICLQCRRPQLYPWVGKIPWRREWLPTTVFWPGKFHGLYSLLLLLSRFSCVQLCDPIDGSPPGSPIPGILQARTLEWVAISFSNAWKWSRSVVSWLFVTPWTATYQAPLSMGFSRQEYWNGVPSPS